MSETSVVNDLLDRLRGRGVQLAAEGDRLRYRAPKNALTAELLRELAENKATLLAALRGQQAPTPPGSQNSHDSQFDSRRARFANSTNSATPAGTESAQALHLPPGPSSAAADTRSGSHNPFFSQNGLTCHAESANIASGGALPVMGVPAAGEQILPAGHASVTLGGRAFTYARSWCGRPLGGGVVAVDTETGLITGVEVPELALASASSGGTHCLVHPDRLGDFVLAHRGRHLAFHNVAFDFWVIARHLERRGEAEALRAWWGQADADLLHDTMVLDMLLRLARHDAFPRPRDLGVVAREYAGLEVSKDDPYRLRYGEIIGKDWGAVEPGFFDYAARDAIATWHAHDALRGQALAAAQRAGVAAAAAAKYGPLSEAVQVKGAIALAQVSRNGMHLDLARSAEVQRGYRAALAEAVSRLRAWPGSAGLFKTDRRTGEPARTRNHAPSLSQNVLRRALTGVASAAAQEAGRPITVPTTAKGAVSVSTKEWAELAHLHPFIRDWAAMTEAAKLCQFFGGLQARVVHPRYSTLVRSGRSCASAPNVQQVPREGGLRELFVPSPGHFLLAADYSFIELRTLAAVCEERYGRSTLADVIRRGVDPHCYTAALLLGMGLEDFMALGRSDPGRYKRLRQSAKALNFGIPGGLGPASLVEYARATYGVGLTPEQARGFRGRLVNEVYPELARYLADDGMAALASNLGVPAEQCWRRFDWKGDRAAGIVGGIRNVVRGKSRKANGEPYAPRFLDGVWGGLAELNRDPDLAPLFRERAAGEELYKRLFWSGVSTLTGRVRGRVGFCEARNTPFQGLAADGAKLALWGLLRAGYRVVGFVHDEFLVELPDRGGYADAAEAEGVARIMCGAMREVTGAVPVACEYALSERWSKEAKAVRQGERLLPWRPTGPAAPAA